MQILQPFVLASFMIVLDPSSQFNVHLNEFLASNQNGLRDEDGEASDWIELVNASKKSANLSGYWLSDDPEEPLKWVFPEVTIPGKGFLVVWASDKNRTGSELHTNFALKKSGESLIFSDPNGNLIDRIDFPSQEEDRSYGRLPDAGAWQFLDHPTPGAPNVEQDPSPTLTFSPKGGFFESPLEIALSGQDPDFQIYYTVDSSTPTLDSNAYEDPIPIDETTILRARIFQGKEPISPAFTHSYFIGTGGSLPSLSLVVAPTDLNDATSGLFSHPQERGDEWERNASIEWFEQGERELGLNCGIRMHGGISRTFDKNSCRLYFSGKYGESRLDIPMFPQSPLQSYKRLVLSGGSNDTIADPREIHSAVWTLVRDALMNELFRQAGVQAIGQRPVRLYLNGQPWGIYWVKERIDKYFIEDHYGYDDFDLLKHEHGVEAKEGDLEEWESLTEFLMTHPLDLEENYRTVTQRIDLNNFITNHAIEMWGENVDWPHNNHYQLRPRMTGAKWQWIPWDSDVVLGSPYVVFADYNMYDHVSGSHRLHADWSTLHFQSLMVNSDFRERFVRTVEELLSTVLSPDHVIEEIDRLAAEIRPDISFETDRWGSSAEDWEKNVEQLRRFVRLRDTAFREHTAEFESEGMDLSKLGPVGILRTISKSAQSLAPEDLFNFAVRQGQ
ncbi:MAG: CotH kinase family protein [Candidatus Omnitrophica bacterium]|nr:CotH kinase family protein [Candidatus Omnitrophota bacterium]